MTESKVAVQERYSRSLRTLRALGALSFTGVAQHERQEAYYQEGLADFMTAVAEGLATDKELEDVLVFSPMRAFRVHEGNAVDATGRRLVDMVSDGADESFRLSQQDERYRNQYNRDCGDVIMAQRVDSLSPGQMHVAIHCYPEEAMERDGDEFWEENLHYRRGMSVLFAAYKIDENTVLQAAYALKNSTKTSVITLLKASGASVPESVTADDLVRYGVTAQVSYDDFCGYGENMIKKHAEIVGDSKKKVSVTEVMKRHEALVVAAFDTYGLAIARSLETGLPEQSLVSYARQLLGCRQQLATEKSTALWAVAQGQPFSDEVGRQVEEVIRYAVIEKLRTLLLQEFEGAYGGTQGRLVPYTIEQATGVHRNLILATYTTPQLAYADLERQLIGSTIAGIQAERKYGGCSGSSMKGAYSQLLSGSENSLELTLTEENSDNEGIGNIHDGYCQVPFCPDGGKLVKVGGCDVCLDNCQPLFDKGLKLEQIVAWYAQKSKPAPPRAGTEPPLVSFSKPPVDSKYNTELATTDDDSESTVNMSAAFALAA